MRRPDQLHVAADKLDDYREGAAVLAGHLMLRRVELHAIALGGAAVGNVRLHRGLPQRLRRDARSEEHTSELQSLMRISYAVFCLKKKKTDQYTREQSQYI